MTTRTTHDPITMDFSQSQSYLQQPAEASQQQQQQQQPQQPQQQQLQSLFGIGSSTVQQQQQGINAAANWFPVDVTMQPDIRMSAFSATPVDAADNLTTWTPSYASVGGDGFASAYSASLADIAEEGEANLGLAGQTGNMLGSNGAYDPLISDTYDVPQLNQAQKAGPAAGANAGIDFSTLLGGTGQFGWSPVSRVQGGGAAGTGGVQGFADGNQASALLSSHASPAESGLSPSNSSTSAYPDSGHLGFNQTSSHVPADVVAAWTRSGSFGQDNLNMALKQVHISDDLRYPSVFGDDNDANTQSGGAGADAGTGRADQLRASLPTLNTTMNNMAMDVDYKALKSADIAAALAQWASTAGGLPSPAAARAVEQAVAFGEALNAASSSAASDEAKRQSTLLATSNAGDANSLTAQLQNLTPVDGTFDRRSLAQPMRNESFEKIKILIHEGRMFSPASATAPSSAAFELPSGLSTGTVGETKSGQAGQQDPKDILLQLFDSVGVDQSRGQVALSQLQNQAQSGEQSLQEKAQAHLALLGLISQGLGNGELSKEQWASMGIPGFDDSSWMAAADAVLGHDLMVMPMRYGMATSDTRTQIGDGSTTSDGANAGTDANGQGLDPSLLSNSRDSSLGPMRQRNWSSSGRARPFGGFAGGSDVYRSQGPSGDVGGASYLGAGSSAHPYGSAEALRRSASERNSQRRHRRAAKSEDITRMAQEGNADYVSRITSQNGMLAPPSLGMAGPGLGTVAGLTAGLGASTPMANNQGLYTTNTQFPGQFQSSTQLASSLSPSTAGNVSEGTPSLDCSRPGTAGSPATTWTGSPSGGSGQTSSVAQAPSIAQMNALASSAAAQQHLAGAQANSFQVAMQGMMPNFGMQPATGAYPGLQYSQTAAPMYGQLSGPSKSVHAGMLPPETYGVGAGMMIGGPGGGFGVGGGPMPGPANHVSAATQAASAARRKTEATFECPVPGCGSTFTRKNNLDGHLRSHNNERPFACPVPGCDKRFARRHDMNRHHDLHMNKKQHVCELCNRRFARLDALNRHLKNTNGTCAAMNGEGGDDDEEHDDIVEPTSIVPSSSSAIGSGSKAAIVAEPASTTSGVEVAISAPTPNFDQQLQELAASSAGGTGSSASTARVQIPILVTPSRQNSGASSGGGGTSARFKGHAL